MYQIKQDFKDFLVKEISNFPVLDKGSYIIFKLKNENYNTLDVVEIVARKLGILSKDVGFAGSKDKKAITEQLISIKCRNEIQANKLKGRIASLELREINLEFLGFASEPITLGSLEGNSFEIVVRDLSEEEVFKFVEKYKEVTKLKIVNYFGEQRFGGNNAEIGKCIIKKDFSRACDLIDDYKVKEHLERKKNDFVGAIRLLPRRLLRLYVNAFQSYLWNKIVKRKLNVVEVPLVGFGTDILGLEEELRTIVEDLLEEENIELIDFVIKQIPNLSLEGSFRKVFVDVNEFKILGEGEDELNKGKEKIKIGFSLPKGSYATVVVKSLF